MLKRVKKAGWPKCRPAHGTEGRYGQAWKPGKKTIAVKDDLGNERNVVVDSGSFKCGCGGVVRIFEHGLAICERCSEIYNYRDAPAGYTMSNRERKRITEKFKYECLHKGEVGVGDPHSGAKSV